MAREYSGQIIHVKPWLVSLHPICSTHDDVDTANRQISVPLTIGPTCELRVIDWNGQGTDAEVDKAPLKTLGNELIRQEAPPGTVGIWEQMSRTLATVKSGISLRVNVVGTFLTIWAWYGDRRETRRDWKVSRSMTSHEHIVHAGKVQRFGTCLTL